MNEEKMRELLEQLAIGWDNEQPYDGDAGLMYDACGGNVDDAYDLGMQQAYWYTARRVAKALGWIPSEDNAGT